MTATPLRDSVTAALLKAAEYVDRFGWDAPTPDDSLPHLHAHLNVAACSIAATTGHPVYDIEALASYRLDESLKHTQNWRGLTAWECDPARTADDIAAALRTAAAAAAAAWFDQQITDLTTNA